VITRSLISASLLEDRVLGWAARQCKFIHEWKEDGRDAEIQHRKLRQIPGRKDNQPLLLHPWAKADWHLNMASLQTLQQGTRVLVK